MDTTFYVLCILKFFFYGLVEWLAIVASGWYLHETKRDCSFVSEDMHVKLFHSISLLNWSPCQETQTEQEQSMNWQLTSLVWTCLSYFGRRIQILKVDWVKLKKPENCMRDCWKERYMLRYREFFIIIILLLIGHSLFIVQYSEMLYSVCQNNEIE